MRAAVGPRPAQPVRPERSDAPAKPARRAVPRCQPSKHSASLNVPAMEPGHGILSLLGERNPAMIPRFHKAAFVVAVGLALSFARPIHAQPSNDDDVKGRIERLEKQNQDLQDALKKLLANPAAGQSFVPAPLLTGSEGVGKDDVRRAIDDYMKEKDAAKKAAEAAAKEKERIEVYRIGRDLNMKASWKDGAVFYTPHE